MHASVHVHVRSDIRSVVLLILMFYVYMHHVYVNKHTRSD